MKVERPFFLQGLHRASQKADCRSSHSRNSRRVFRLPRLFNKDASASHFVNPKINSAQTTPRGKSKEGGRSPLRGRFMGDCQGGESKLPLDYSFFRPSTALSFSYEKESGVETFAFLARQKRMGRRRHNAPFRRRKDMARGAAVTAHQIKPCLRRHPAQQKKFRTSVQTKEEGEEK